MSIECVEEYTSWSIKIAFLFICILFMAMLPHLHPDKFVREINVTEFKLWIYLLPLIWLYLSVWSMASIFLQTEADGFRYVIGGVGVVMILSTASWVVLH
ncbi:hypothetical protein MY8738_006988 [Beauveria namnaoensis]